MKAERSSRARVIASGVLPLVIITVMIAYMLGPGSEMIEFGVQLPDLTIEQIEFVDSEIHVTIRNTGPIPVEVAVADINDRIQPAAIEPDKNLERYEAALVRIPFEWNEGEPYVVGVTTSDGTRFEKEVAAAFPASKPDAEMLGFFAIIGTYVGIIPVMVGLLWLPFIRRINKSWYVFFLSLTAGLLLFLGVDAAEEALEVAGESLAESFNGGLLVATVIVLSFLGLLGVGRIFAGDSATTRPVIVALMISVGIGLHNLGEGLAIGAAVGLGQVALSTFLIIGFALHNTTEGIAIAVPLSKGGATVARLVALGLVAGSPAILGAWIGGFFYSPMAAVIFLSIGVGAILQVMIVILQWIKKETDGGLVGAPVAGGIAAGMGVMYITSIII